MNTTMNVLLLGGGGRECALARRFAHSPLLGQLYIAPGNAGTAVYGRNISLDITDGQAVADACRELKVGLLVVGPEAPLVAGVADTVRCQCPGTAVFGPDADGAALEGSKIFAKEFMTRHGVPTAPFIAVDSSNIAEAEEYLRGLSYPAVIKADGLCGGKGSVIVDSLADAQATLHDMLGGRFGDASRRVIIEDYLPGRECSVFVLTDGKDFAVLPVARDYKRAGDGDTGPNTGGMGAVSPVEYADSKFMERVAERVILPTVQGLQSDDIPYCGVLYLGLMEVGGEPYLLEYNVRMGDPETAVVLERTTGDVLRAFYSVARGAAREVCLGIAENAAVAVVVAAKGYPGAVKTGAPVTVEAQPETGAAVLLGGAVKGADGVARVASGRVATVVGVDKDIFNARLIAYRTADTVKFLDASMRRDIAF